MVSLQFKQKVEGKSFNFKSEKLSLWICAFVGVFTNKTGIALVKLLIKTPINGGNVGRPIKAKIGL